MGPRVPGGREGECDTPAMVNVSPVWAISFVVSFLFLYFAVRLGVHHGMRDFTRSEAARREQRP